MSPHCAALRARQEALGAKFTEVGSSHVPMLSQPDLVIAVIREAAAAIQHG